METNVNLFYHHKMQFSDIDTMLPWERDVYLILIQAAIEKEEKEKNGG